MSAFSYDCSISPNPMTATATLAASGSSLTATVVLPSFDISVKPSGNVTQWILSAIALPLVDIIVTIVKGQIQSSVSDSINPITLATVNPVSVNLEGSDSVTLTPGGFSLSGSGGYAKLTGTVTVS